MEIKYWQTGINSCFELGMAMVQFNFSNSICFGFYSVPSIRSGIRGNVVAYWKLKQKKS